MQQQSTLQFTARKTSIYLDSVKSGGTQWKVSPPFNPGRAGDLLKLKTAGPDSHLIELRSDTLFIDSPVKAQGREAIAEIRPDLRPDYYEFEVYIDGQFAEAGSSPGVIIE
jgi:hypothetical protein